MDSETDNSTDTCIPDITYKIRNKNNIKQCNSINSNQVDVRKISDTAQKPIDKFVQPLKDLKHINMEIEQDKDPEISLLKSKYN
jgi:hypothetical protein